jgi:hypothetical protein
MTLWIFGDTYVQANDVDCQWMYKLAHELKCDINSLAMNGTALEFTYQRFNIARHKIKKYDTVVVALTNFDRRWFFKQYPQVAEFDKSPTDNKKETKAIELFRKYLDHKEIYQVYLMDFLFNLQAISEDLELHTIVIPCFDDVNTFLMDKKDLFPSIEIANGHFSNLIGNDVEVTLNHMNPSKHEILFRKFLAYIRDKVSINLNEGF